MFTLLIIFFLCIKYRVATINDPFENELTVKGLQEGKSYEFRVAALNKAGIGKWSQTEEAIEARQPDCAPKASGGFYGSIKEIIIKSGEILRINIPYQASPKPQVIWSKVSAIQQ